MVTTAERASRPSPEAALEPRFTPSRSVASLDDLLVPFHEAEKPRARFRVGAEAEKFGVFREDGRPVPFEGPRGVHALLLALARDHGWTREREVPDGEVIAVRRGEAAVTLEPGAQLELSGAPHETIHDICRELHAHMAELAVVGRELGIVWLGLGFHPWARQDELPWVPKLRYPIMREYMPTRGRLALDMMRRTCTVQANVDYANEDDAMRKLRVAMRLQPIVTAMFANSPWVEGHATGERSHRAGVWLEMDVDRSGLLPFAWHDRMGYRDYVEWALDVPMFLFKREGRAVVNTGQTFRDFMASGYQGHRATIADWELHLNTLFPEARLKRTLEMRGADSQHTDMICALPALWKGLLYDDTALGRAEALAENVAYDALEAARPDIVERALRAELGGREVAEWATDLLDVATAGLARIGALSDKGRDETIHLSRLRELVTCGQCPADVLLERVHEGPDFREQIFALAHA